MVYGLGVCSDIELPELSATRARADVNIFYRHRASFSLPSVENKTDFWANGSEAYISNTDIGAFHIQNGREIIIYPIQNADLKQIRLFLLGKVFGVLLHQRGLLALHGSAIVVDDSAVAFLGNSGSGKSTIAASIIADEYAMITDDLVVVDASSGMPMIQPAIPQIKLCHDAAKMLGYDVSSLPTVGRETNSKRIINFASRFCTNPSPLRRIYVLVDSDYINIKQLDQQDSVIELIRNSYCLHSLNAKVNLSSHFSQCAAVVKSVPVYRLMRPIASKSLPQLVQMVKNDIINGIRK
jgi:hypothetical protein